ncbi:MAG: bifunctional diaminohydroxyphosphoribosylaminopyrimidine deaminase/5-amino-6-(5-phosphoribosylamino)uracil reductase, partial [Verrucomicrobia bacterium]|nr:bifunctional diaminohydroxyphosphoribosylaminopyrimidine deaminase/5-amino-6-(5-phosphoribosylamino)uracil reductase [Verrucomicrobiota bacterium]
GLAELRRDGIQVTTGVLDKECTRLNAGFNKWIISGRPWVIAKAAQSLDGRLTRPIGESSRLSNSHSIRMVHRLRATVDAILIGAETVRKDDPELTVRYGPTDHQPLRVVVTKTGMLPIDARVFVGEQDTIIYKDRSWSDVLDDLGRRSVTRLLVEGGGQIFGQLFDNYLIDELWFFLTPRLVGGDKPTIGGVGVQELAGAPRLVDVRYLRLKDDLLIKGDLQWPKNPSRAF